MVKLAAKGKPGYAADANPTARAVKRFTRRDFDAERGWTELEFELHHVQKPFYFRLRGTDNAPGNAYTDADGNPLMDPPGVDTKARAFEDLWFYSNPIFVDVR